MKNGKSPGTDGYNAEFYKFFWKDIGNFVLESLNESFNTGELSITQKQGLITLLPKGNKPRELIKNWRPITLLNVDYKLLAECLNESFNTGELSITQKQGLIMLLPKGNKPRELIKNWRPITLLNVDYKLLAECLNESFNTGELSITQKQGLITLLPKGNKPRELIKNWWPITLLNVDYKLLAGVLASRMKEVLPSIIQNEQKGFLKNRYIGENIRTIADSLEYIRQKKNYGYDTSNRF